MLIEYIHSYCTYFEAISPMLNMKTWHTMVTETHIIWDDVILHNKSRVFSEDVLPYSIYKHISLDHRVTLLDTRTPW